MTHRRDGGGSVPERSSEVHNVVVLIFRQLSRKILSRALTFVTTLARATTAHCRDKRRADASHGRD